MISVIELQGGIYNTGYFFDRVVLLRTVLSEKVRGVIAVKMAVLYSPKKTVL